ncbi:MAG: iron ABC transporter permease [Flavobacteriaceae bacterium]|nr:iron ABC transporter permease [Flavobacteriaceae bacterium]
MWKEIFYEKRFWVLFSLLIIFCIISLMIGSISTSFYELFRLNHPDNSLLKRVVLEHRLPRTLTAMLTGIALPISGWVLQEFFRNPLAGPSVLGITSASGLGVALVIVLGTSLGLSHWVNQSWLLILGALAGALIATILLIWTAHKISSTTSLIIVGFMLAALAGAFIGVLEFFASGKDLKSYVLWSFGSLNGLSNDRLYYFLICCIIGVLLVIFKIDALIKMQLGELYARTMGVDVRSLRLQLIIASSVLTGVTTALVGPIAFIGLAVPHICRIYLKTADFRKLFIYIIMVGVILMIVFSVISEIFPGGALPINIITALLGAPIVLSIVLNYKGREL